MLRLIAEAEDWLFVEQETHSLIGTGNSDAPFISTTEIMFRNPRNGNIFRTLQMTYIFDTETFEWAPLISSATEFDLKCKDKYKKISLSRMWQGDYDVPSFQKWR